jgi:hypothetical protein
VVWEQFQFRLSEVREDLVSDRQSMGSKIMLSRDGSLFKVRNKCIEL